MKSKTQNGLLLLIIGLLIYLIIGLITSISNFFIDDYETFSILGGVVLVIFSFIAAILILAGAIFFLIGRREFGEKHQKNVIYALIIFVINIFFTTILTSALVFIGFSSMLSSSGNNFIPFSIAILIISFVSAILVGVMYYFALIELEDEKGKLILYAGIISSIIISIITSVYYYGYMNEIFRRFSSSSGAPSFSGIENIGGIGILSIIPGILFIFALFIPYNRIIEGKLIPQDLTAYTPAYGSSVPGRLCPECGRGIPMDALLCPYCGKDFDYQNLQKNKTFEEKNNDNINQNNHEIDNRNEKKINGC
jgi:MFS family permease